MSGLRARSGLAEKRVAGGTSGGHSPDRTELPVWTLARMPSPITGLSIGISRMLWRGRATSWEQEGSSGLENVVQAVLARCRPAAGAVAVDLGCGSGQVTFPLARRCAHVLAVDIDPEAIAMLTARARRDHVANVQAVPHPVETLGLPLESVDLVVSNYTLHHLRDADKRLLLERSFRWLRPGGRLVIGDMMLGRGTHAADREIIREKVRGLIRQGPGGWWRIAKNAVRFLMRVQEKPLRPPDWASIIREVGFENVSLSRVVAEACVISADKPSRPTGLPRSRWTIRVASGKLRHRGDAGHARRTPGPQQRSQA
jgi:ubiquinone/menaquinone biosynthesis C-methylase UbiE